MNNNIAFDFRNAALVRQMGIEALRKELGIVGAVYFLRQFYPGYGDYTTEREALLEGITLDDIIKDIQERDKKNQSD